MKRLLFIFCCLIATISKSQVTNNNSDGEKQRAFFVQSLTRIADPVLTALGKNELKKTMPVEAKPGVLDRKKFTYLEAFGRTLSGMAPWLELGEDDSREGKIRKKYIQLSRQCIDNATSPSSPDFMNFNDGAQPLVDAAFFAQALLRAPNQLWDPLNSETKKNVIAALKSARVIKPYESNWLLFSAMVEAALLQFDGSCDTSRIENAIRKHFTWYKGDGMYGDGPNFHWDYYNSFVIQPMLIEVLQVLNNKGFNRKKEYDIVLARAARYAAIQERLISPEGTYPPIGRSIAYRFGAFQVLSKIAHMHALSKEIAPQQVRAALYTVIKKQLTPSATFDKNGWLTIGFYGHQPGLGEGYISTGSLYLCSQAFIVLGLPATDPFWQGKNVNWTSKQIWMGENLPVDHSVE